VKFVHLQPLSLCGCLRVVACVWLSARGCLRVVACVWLSACGCLRVVVCVWFTAFGCLCMVGCNPPSLIFIGCVVPMRGDFAIFRRGRKSFAILSHGWELNQSHREETAGSEVH